MPAETRPSSAVSPDVVLPDVVEPDKSKCNSTLGSFTTTNITGEDRWAGKPRNEEERQRIISQMAHTLEAATLEGRRLKSLTRQITLTMATLVFLFVVVSYIMIAMGIQATTDNVIDEILAFAMVTPMFLAFSVSDFGPRLSILGVTIFFSLLVGVHQTSGGIMMILDATSGCGDAPGQESWMRRASGGICTLAGLGTIAKALPFFLIGVLYFGVAALSQLSCYLSVLSPMMENKKEYQFSDQIWKAGAVWYITGGVARCYLFVIFSLEFSLAEFTEVHRTMWVACIVEVFLLGYFATKKWMRQAVLASLMNIFDTHERMVSAAGVSAIIGETTPKKVINDALALLRGIQLGNLDQARITSEGPDAQLFELTEPAGPREIDAFISHSWRDDSVDSWELLSAWGTEFVKTHNRMPVLWLDKACISEDQLQQSLVCLPVFLACCEDFVILYSPTYLQRLWCIMELFVYLHMGGHWDRVHLVLPPLSEHYHQTSCHQFSLLQSLFKGATHFDVTDTDCANMDDKQFLLNIIDAAGGVSQFNIQVQEILQGLCDKVCDQWKSHAATTTHNDELA